jgi:hypothetical protein
MQSFVVALVMTGQGPRQATTATRRPRRRSSPRGGSPLVHDTFPVVGLGASAGGLDAARRLLAVLPAASARSRQGREPLLTLPVRRHGETRNRGSPNPAQRNILLGQALIPPSEIRSRRRRPSADCAAYAFSTNLRLRTRIRLEMASPEAGALAMHY